MLRKLTSIRQDYNYANSRNLGKPNKFIMV